MDTWKEERYELVNSQWSDRNEKSLKEYSQSYKAWWKHSCVCGEIHEWKASIEIRKNQGSNCPICWNKSKFCPCKSLAKINPELASEWHPTKNILTPDQVTCANYNKFWWICNKSKCIHAHEWESSVSNRHRHGSKCLYCTGQKVCSCYSLATLRPDIVEDWHPTKNILFPDQVSIGSGRKIWWICKKHQNCSKSHEWQSSVNKRVISLGCPFCINKKLCICISLAKLRPDLAKDWHPIKNSLTPEEIYASSSKQVWWLCNNHEDCLNSHEWKDKIYDRIHGKGCPFCSRRKLCLCTSLAKLRPDIAKDWHPTKNSLTLDKVCISNGDKVWWLCNNHEDCPNSHEWRAEIYRRREGRGCPFCSRRKLCVCTSLAKLRPDLAKEWHPTKNSLTPEEIGVSSSKKVWWLCPKGHEWFVSAGSRSRTYCPYCNISKGEKQVSKILEKLNIKYIKEYKIRLSKQSCLRFDFYLPDYNKAIEFDGLQHFKPVKYFGGETHLTKTQERDNRKNAYCNEANISLLRIHYKDMSETIDLVEFLIRKDFLILLLSSNYP